MSAQDDSEEVGRREVAWRVFAAEFDDADFSYAESDEERAPNYVVTPTGARINRLFVVGVLTEVERVSDDVLRARIVDPTGAFVVYAGQYQPDELAFLESADTPSFVALTGKARTFQPEDADVVYTSIRPESINAVDAETRDRWTVRTAEQTVERVGVAADALAREERDEELRDALVEAGVRPDLAAGVPLALDHYGTTETYLEAVRELAIEAAEVVAGEREEVSGLDVAPDEGGPVDADLTADRERDREHDAEPEPTSPSASDTESSEASTDEESANASAASAETESAESADTATETESDTGTLGDFEPAEASTGDSDAAASGAESVSDVESGSEAEAATDEMYEMSQEEREEVREEFDVGFSSGNEVSEAGEAGIEPEVEPADAEREPDVEETDEEVAETAADFEESIEDEPVDEDEAAAEADLDDLEDAVVDVMQELDDGDGADRDELVTTIVERYDVSREEVADAVQDALMSGRCYESGEDNLKAI